jgi:hypothetical protein
MPCSAQGGEAAAASAAAGGAVSELHVRGLLYHMMFSMKGSGCFFGVLVVLEMKLHGLRTALDVYFLQAGQAAG